MNKNKSEIGVIFSRLNEKKVEYLSIKLHKIPQGSTLHFKAFLNSGWDENEHKDRPKFIIYEPQTLPNDRSKKLD